MLGFVFMAPLVLAFWMSQLDYAQNLYQPQWVGPANYGRVLASPEFWQCLSNTGLFWLAIVPWVVFLPPLLAILMRRNVPGMAWLRVLVYLPTVLPLVVVSLAWKWVVAYDGVLNAMLAAMGWAKVPWLVLPETALWAVAVMVVWKALGYYSALYLTHVQGISNELYEAAEVDGATGWRKHWHMTLPLLRPAMGLVAMMSSLATMKLFTEVYVLTQGGPMGTTRTWVLWLYQKAFEQLDLGFATAAGLLMLVPLVALSGANYLLQNQRRRTERLRDG